MSAGGNVMNKIEFSRNAQATVADKTYEKLEELIVHTELKPGVMYTEKELSELVGFGRTPVREALQRLAIEGLVTIKQRRGIQITDVDADTQFRLLEIRRPIQNFTAEYAARRATEEDRRQLNSFADELDAALVGGPATRAQALAMVRRAHDLVVSASHNEFVVKTLRIVQGLSRRFWIYHMKREDFIPAAKLHARLLREVAKGDVDGAIAASNALIDYLEGFARQTIRWG